MAQHTTNSDSSSLCADRSRRARRRMATAVWEGLEQRMLLSGSTAVWTGSAGNGLWSDATNWSGNALPTAGQNVEFDNLTGTGTPQIVQVDQAVEIGSLGIDNTILQGPNTITLDGDVTCGTSNYVSILAPITLTHQTTLTVTNGTGGTFSDLQFCDAISDGGHGYGLTVTGGGEVDIVPCTIDSAGNAAYVNANVTANYTGPTIVNDGSIFTANANFASAVAVSGNAQFFASGSASSMSVSDAGSEFGAYDQYNFNPDVLTISDGLTLGAGTTFVQQIKGSALGDGTTSTGYSAVDVTGRSIDLNGATLDGALDNTVYTPKAGDVLTIIKNQTGHSITGTFAGLAQGAEVSIHGFPFVISYDGGASHRDVTLAAATIPTIVNTTSPRIVRGITDTLSALGSDTAAAGEAGLTYTWTLASAPPGARAPIFGSNGTNSAQKTSVRLYKAGTYHFVCTATNAVGESASTGVRVIVAPTPTAIRLTPHGQKVEPDASLQIVASVLDQFNHPLNPTPSIAYRVESGPGTISSTGLFTADSTGSGAAIVLVDADELSAAIGVTVE
jgi:hypothetical protein